MTSYPNALQRPALRNASSVNSRPPSRTSSQIFDHPPRSVPPQVEIDHTQSSPIPHDGPEMALKRQKLNDGRRNLVTPGESRVCIFPSQDRGISPSAAKGIPGPEGGTNPSTSTNGNSSQSLPPFPPRPSPNGHPNQLVDRVPIRTARGEVQAKPYISETPSIAPKYKNGATADFFPWIGTHPEDALSENSIRTGYYDKLSIMPSDSGLAKPHIWPSIKHKSGLVLLSNVFHSAFDHRQAHGTITARSTFKPPPRVTLTDTKREAWLRDLADASIPLRRLSRTIPHGIRGRSLLDQSLAKNIPIWRAVWLAKCVGANEIRAFKRKGTGGAFATGGETKWIKDWTANVEQFIEALIDSCGSVEWKSRMTYGLRLASHIYSEHLLDAEHFLDWIVTSLRGSHPDHLPVWLLILQIHWNEFLLYRRRGKHLAVAMLEQLQKLRSLDVQPVYAQLVQKLSTLVRSFILSSPGCFLLPDCWTKYEGLVESCFDDADKANQRLFCRLATRNQRLAKKPQADSANRPETSRQRLIVILDGVSAGFNLQTLSDLCLRTVEDRTLLITTVVEWATTPYRTGLCRLYIALRLLRCWSRAGLDLDGPLAAILGGMSVPSRTQLPKPLKLIAELVRSRHFSIGKYLQWLMARGPIPPTADEHTITNQPSLLNDIPLDNLPPHILNLRRILLGATGSSPGDEQMCIEIAKGYLRNKISFLNPLESSESPAARSDILPPLNGSMRLAISSWIRQSIVSHICAGENGCLDKSDVVARPSLTLVDFQTVCAVLEDFEDFAVLSDVLDVVVSEATERDLLDGAAEKINTHFDIVYAIGALPELFCRLISRLGDFRTRSPSYRSLLLSLIDLGQRLPNEGRKVRTLHKELVLCEPKSAIAACSPVSDYMAESLQAADSSFAEEMGHLLNSGTSMDRQIMLKVFMAITLKLRQGWNNADVSTPSCFDFLAQLRAFDNVEFDKLLMDWLPEILLWPKPSKLASVLLPLICSGTLSLKSILDRYVMFLREPSASKSKARLSVDVLDFLVAMDFKDQAPALDANPLPQRMYRYFVERACLFRESPSSFVFLIESVFRASACGNPDVESSAQSLTSSPGFQNLIHDLFIHNPSILHELEGFFASGNAQTTILSVIARILGLSTDSAGNKLEQSQADKPSEEAFGSRELHYFLHTANDFNIDICLLKLRLSFAISSAKTADTGPELDSAAAVLIRETNSSSESFSQIWPRLISSLPKNLAIKFHLQAAFTLLNAPPEVSSNPDLVEDESEIRGNGLMAAIEMIEPHVPLEAGNLLANISDKLGVLLAHQELHSPPLNTFPDVEGHPPREGTPPLHHPIYSHLDTLLCLLRAHQSILIQPKLSQLTLSRLLTTLGRLLIMPTLGPYSSLTTQIFDTIALLSDFASAETNSHCILVLRNQHHIQDIRLQFLFGYPDHEDGDFIRLVSVPNGGASADPKAKPGPAGIAPDPGQSQAFPLRRWEMVQDATPIIGENDTSLSLSLFGARKSVL